MTRVRASAAHLALSMVVAFVVYLAVRDLWYPGPLYDLAGGRDLFLLVVSVDVVLGPLITLIVFRPGKRGLAFDMVVIVLLQVSALGYGLWSISLSRPVYVVFVKDRFELTRASDIEPEDLAKAKGTEYEALSWTGPRYIGVRFPTDEWEKFNLMVSGIGGKDIHTYPRYYAPYEATAREVIAHAATLPELAALNPARTAEIRALPSELAREPAQIGFLPLKTGKGDLTVLVDVRDGRVLRLADFKPWEYQ